MGQTGLRQTLTTLGFGGVAALGSIPWAMVVGPILGRPWALATYCLGAVVLYIVAIAPSWSRGVLIGGLACLPAISIGILAPWPADALTGAALILAVARSGFLYRSKPARALVIEGGLAALGLLIANWLGGPTLLETALAIWSYLLVQSLFFLLGGVANRESEEPRIDPFERAHKRALALMEEA